MDASSRTKVERTRLPLLLLLWKKRASIAGEKTRSTRSDSPWALVWRRRRGGGQARPRDACVLRTNALALVLTFTHDDCSSAGLQCRTELTARSYVRHYPCASQAPDATGSGKRRELGYGPHHVASSCLLLRAATCFAAVTLELGYSACPTVRY